MNECAICLSDISETDIVAICNKCKRPFCTKCIEIQMMYCENNNIIPSCPTCRRNNVEFNYINKFTCTRTLHYYTHVRARTCTHYLPWYTLTY